MRALARHTLREIHKIATTYHWPLSEILGLAHERRRDFLALMEEEEDLDLFGDLVGDDR